MTDRITVAIYARVSSDQQAKQQTIASQIAALKERVLADGLQCPDAFAFIDDGYSGTTLLRPALERLRDQIAAGLIERLYVHSPDRLARRYAYQILLMDEFKRHHVEIVFLNREIGKSPEDEMMLQMQGMIAEYERAKIMERCRRGKLHAARRGCVEVLHSAPYGYRYRPRASDMPAAFVVQDQEADVVRKIFHWVGVERLTLGAVGRRLTQQAVASPKGQATWPRSTIAAMLSNPTYIGKAAYGRTRVCERRARVRPSRGQPEVPRRPYATERTQPEDQIVIAVPALVTEELFAAVAEQMSENKKRHREGKRGVSYLLQGLVVCAKCGRALYGKVATSLYKGKRSRYTYYRCPGLEPYRFGGGDRLCDNRQVKTDRLEQAVWEDVSSLLSDPARLKQEYERRVLGTPSTNRSDWDQKHARLQKAKQAVARLIDAFASGLLEPGEFEPRIKEARGRVQTLQEECAKLNEEIATTQHVQEVLDHWQDFADEMDKNLQEASWETRRQVMLALVKRVEVGIDEVHIVYKVPGLKEPNPADSFLQDCPRNASTIAWTTSPAS
jgi:site-specific DNA recombinase